MKIYKLLALSACLSFIFCQADSVIAANADSLQSLKAGMNRDQVRQVLGNPATVKEEKKDNPEENLEVWDYPPNYLVRFKNGALIYWGQKQDWVMPSDYSGRTLHEEESEPQDELEETIDD